jgi:predicted Rossmann fold flavoprotein
VRIGIVGGGAAGFFGALAAAAVDPSADVDLFEATRQPLQKVRISGGGRCNVTHHCFEPRELVKGYPRGARELLGPFTRFGPRETVEWFERHGVRLKAEDDGRMFPVTDQSATVVNCLTRAARDAGIQIRLGRNVRHVVAMAASPPRFEIELSDGSRERADRVLLATGGSPQGYRLAASLGHTVVPCVPSLFTFTVNDPRLEGLAGISFHNVELTLASGAARVLRQTGPMLVTHWGMSGPAVLTLSAWGARMLAERRYRAALTVNFLPERTAADVREELLGLKDARARTRVQSDSGFGLPARYWSRLVHHAGIAGDTTWSNVSSKALTALVGELTAARFDVSGKGIFKDEFVTCGGVTLSEVDFRTMESRRQAGLYLAGEILDIDGITGGFNFQSAWTTGWLAGTAGRGVPLGDAGPRLR